MFSAMSDHHQISHLPPLLPPPPPHLERKWKPHLETAPNCPRCASSNTKFCYYNNYSFSQPRYFCKACRRYWTKGGSLRNVPVGGGCRKSRRAKPSRSSAHSSDRVSSTKSDVACQSHSNDGSSSGSDIDLAAVFARFLNSHNLEEEPPNEANALTSSPESVDPLDNLTAENSEIFFQGLSDLLLDQEIQTQKEKQEPAGNENFPFGLQTEVGVDELWPEAAAMAMAMPSSSCSFSWQPPQLQLDQDLDSFACNYNANHLRVSDQFCQVGDNWSSFDVAAGFEGSFDTVNNVEYS